MCGRISLFAELGDLASQFRFNLGLIQEAYRPSWNIAPTAPVLAVMAEHRSGMMRWGFTFSARRSGGSSPRPLFNARSETLTERPAFRAAFAHHRCLVPVNGFYEWRDEGGGRKPLWIHRTDERPFALAGIYNDGPDPAACVIACAPNSLMEPIHHRMPVMLNAEDHDAWLATETKPETLRDLLAPREWPGLTVRPVSGAVNQAGSDGLQLIDTGAAASPRLLRPV